jgi:hypothetical protein
MGKLNLLALLAVALAAGSAHACEPVRGYRIPTNIELVQDADVIVLARVVSGPAPGAAVGVPWSGPGQVLLDPIEPLKGSPAGKALRLFGTTVERNGRPVKAAPTPLTEAHPSAYEGACVRVKYSPGTLVVAMFKRSPQGLRELSFPFARETEDVAGPNATWVRAVRYYVAASQGGRTAQRRAFTRLKAKLAADGDSQDREIAEDIGRYLSITDRTKGHPLQMW